MFQIIMKGCIYLKYRKYEFVFYKVWYIFLGKRTMPKTKCTVLFWISWRRKELVSHLCRFGCIILIILKNYDLFSWFNIYVHIYEFFLKNVDDTKVDLYVYCFQIQVESTGVYITKTLTECSLVLGSTHWKVQCQMYLLGWWHQWFQTIALKQTFVF